MQVQYFYDLTDDKQYSSDAEGNLVQLCADCAASAGSDVRLASRGDEESACELCDAPQPDDE